MGLRELVMELLQSADSSRLERLAANEPRAVRHLVGRLWDPDRRVRQLAAAAVGAAAAVHRELGHDVLKRLVWALNDESATNGIYGLAAIGEIGARDPELARDFLGPVASLARDAGLRSAIFRALGRVAETAPELVEPLLAELGAWLDREDAEQVAAFGELEAKVGHGAA
jgi:hypothetical protein